MFSVGDKIVYGSMGVCTIESIGIPDMPGATRECYVLKPHYVANSKVYAPVETSKVRMRHLLTAQQVQELIDGMPKMEALAPGEDRQELYNTCREAIKSADSTLLARLLKTLYDRRTKIVAQRKIVPSAEKEFFDTAEKVLYGEIADALQMPIAKVETYISGRLDGDASFLAS